MVKPLRCWRAGFVLSAIGNPACSPHFYSVDIPASDTIFCVSLHTAHDSRQQLHHAETQLLPHLCSDLLFMLSRFVPGAPLFQNMASLPRGTLSAHPPQLHLRVHSHGLPDIFLGGVHAALNQDCTSKCSRQHVRYDALQGAGISPMDCLICLTISSSHGPG